METLKKIIKFLIAVIGTLFCGITGIFFIQEEKKKMKEEYKAEQAKEKKENEIKEKSVDDIAADSPNPDTISTNIEREQEELRERIRNRLNKNISGNGSSSNN